MRLYTFINFYLSQIQQGIQTAHIVHELFNRYKEPGPQTAALNEWSVHHKTIIVLNGGVDQNLQELVELFRWYEFPYAQFYEDEGLCKARTGCGIVLPEWIYNAQRVFDASKKEKQLSYVYDNGIDTPFVVYEGDKYFDLIDAVKSKRLA